LERKPWLSGALLLLQGVLATLCRLPCSLCSQQTLRQGGQGQTTLIRTIELFFLLQKGVNFLSYGSCKFSVAFEFEFVLDLLIDQAGCSMLLVFFLCTPFCFVWKDTYALVMKSKEAMFPLIFDGNSHHAVCRVLQLCGSPTSITQARDTHSSRALCLYCLLLVG
jgi:hypothetical protein